MKKISRTILVFLLCLTFFSGCGVEEKHSLANIEDFMSSYILHNVDEDYYESNDLDYHFLYNVTLDDANVTKKDKGRKEYELPLVVSLNGTTAEMVICTDKKDYITSIEVSMKESAFSMFETLEDVNEYYATIITSAKQELSNDSAWDIIENLWEQKNPDNDNWKHISVDNIEFHLMYMDNTIKFSIEIDA